MTALEITNTCHGAEQKQASRQLRRLNTRWSYAKLGQRPFSVASPNSSTLSSPSCRHIPTRKPGQVQSNKLVSPWHLCKITAMLKQHVSREHQSFVLAPSCLPPLAPTMPPCQHMPASSASPRPLLTKTGGRAVRRQPCLKWHLAFHGVKKHSSKKRYSGGTQCTCSRVCTPTSPMPFVAM